MSTLAKTYYKMGKNVVLYPKTPTMEDETQLRSALLKFLQTDLASVVMQCDFRVSLKDADITV